MKKIFVDNFKGFKNQVIELKDINFFVGENSTGKTSILKLINILNNGLQWSQFVFNSDQVELGHFNEIVNMGSPEHAFTIAIENSTTKKEQAVDARLLFKFEEFKSTPKIDQIKFVYQNLDVFVQIVEKHFVYKTKKHRDISFEDWVADRDFKGRGKRIPFPGSRVPFLLILSFVRNAIKSGKSTKVMEYDFNESKLFEKYLWTAPIRAKPKRIYESYNFKFSPEGNHIPSLIRNLLVNSSEKDIARVKKVLVAFGKDSNLFDEIEVNNYGAESTAPFEINIKYRNVAVKLPNVGYGVSQCLPLIVEILAAKQTMFSIQQPEVHLHPKAQAAFGSFLYNANVKDKNTFLIETHSDFTINRFRYNLYENPTKGVNSQVLFFQRQEDGNTITPLNISSNGSFDCDVPSEYRDFFIDEELKMLEM